MRIALAQINPTVGDFSGNLRKIAEFVERAAAEGAALVMFPELATCGYPPADLLEKESFVRRAEETLAAVAELTGGEGVADRESGRRVGRGLVRFASDGKGADRAGAN